MILIRGHLPRGDNFPGGTGGEMGLVLPGPGPGLGGWQYINVIYSNLVSYLKQINNTIM